MDKLLINPKTSEQLQRFRNRPSHAVLLTGIPGSGLSFIATITADTLLPQKNNESLIIRIVPNEKGGIAIETIRELRLQLKLKNSSFDAASKVVIIDPVDAMQHEAQNALLKMLEEPPHGVVFILLSHNPSKLLTTIASRCTHISVLPVSLSDANNYFQSNPSLKKNYAISGGAAGLLVQLMNNENSPLVQQIILAKKVLALPLYDRLLVVENELKQKDIIELFLDALRRVCIAGLEGAANKKQWLHNTAAVSVAQSAFHANVQNKLVLDNLFLNLH